MNMALESLSIENIKLLESPKYGSFSSIIEHTTSSVWNLPKRIITSFLPPTKIAKNQTFVDLLGPSLAVILFILLLEYGFSKKLVKDENETPVSAVMAVSIYVICVTFFSYFATRVVASQLTLLELVTLIGYSFFGCVICCFVPYILSNLFRDKDIVFILCLIIFGSLSNARVFVILLFAIDLPIARLLVCSFLSCAYELFLIYAYYVYMDPVFIYGKDGGR